MRDLRRYWEEVRAIEGNLPESVWLVPGKQTDTALLVEVPKMAAARFLQSGAHRRATENEIAAHRAQQDSQRRQTFYDDLRRKGIAVIPVSKTEAPVSTKRRA